MVWVFAIWVGVHALYAWSDGLRVLFNKELLERLRAGDR